MKRVIVSFELTDVQYEVMNRIAQAEGIDHSEYVRTDVISSLESGIDMSFPGFENPVRRELHAKLDKAGKKGKKKQK